MHYVTTVDKMKCSNSVPYFEDKMVKIYTLIATSDQNDQNLNPILEQGGQSAYAILDHKDNQSIFQANMIIS